MFYYTEQPEIVSFSLVLYEQVYVPGIFGNTEEAFFGRESACPHPPGESTESNRENAGFVPSGMAIPIRMTKIYGKKIKNVLEKMVR